MMCLLPYFVYALVFYVFEGYIGALPNQLCSLTIAAIQHCWDLHEGRIMDSALHYDTSCAAN